MPKAIKIFFHYLLVPFVFIALSFNVWRAKIKARKYKKEPLLHTADVRYKLVYKICKQILFCKKIRVDAKGFEDMSLTAKLLISNHKSNMDAIVMIKVLYEINHNLRFTFLCKKELQKNKFIRACIDLIDGIYIDRNNPREIFDVIKREKELLSQNYTLVIFPEGTRVFSHEFKEFKPGAFKVAYESFVPICFFTLYGTSGRLDKNKEYKSNGNVIVKYNGMIRPQEFITTTAINLANKIKNIIKNSYDKILNDKNKKEGEK